MVNDKLIDNEQNTESGQNKRTSIFLYSVDKCFLSHVVQKN